MLRESRLFLCSDPLKRETMGLKAREKGLSRHAPYGEVGTQRAGACRAGSRRSEAAQEAGLWWQVGLELSRRGGNGGREERRSHRCTCPALRRREDPGRAASPSVPITCPPPPLPALTKLLSASPLIPEPPPSSSPDQRGVGGDWGP